MCVFFEIIKRKSPAHIVYDNDGFGWTYGNEEKDVNEEIAEGIRTQLESSL